MFKYLLSKLKNRLSIKAVCGDVSLIAFYAMRSRGHDAYILIGQPKDLSKKPHAQCYVRIKEGEEYKDYPVEVWPWPEIRISDKPEYELIGARKYKPPEGAWTLVEE